MKKNSFICGAIILLAIFFSSIQIVASSQDLNINIKIDSVKDGYKLTSKLGFDILLNGGISVNKLSDKEITVKYSDGLLITTENASYGPYHDAMIQSLDNKTIYNNKTYNGKFYLSEKTKALVNQVQLEEYVASVVASEVGSSFEEEAIKAQAVAARSYALSNLKKYMGEGFDLSNDIYSQLYYGEDRITDKIKKAVKETDSLCAFYNGEIINATYSSSNGGVTASSLEVWGNKYDYLISKKDIYSENTPNVNWEVTIGQNEMDLLIKQITDKNGLMGLKLEKNPLGRVLNVYALYKNDEIKIPVNRFRNLLGTTKLKSTYFTIDDITNDSINISNNKEDNGKIMDNKEVDLSDYFIDLENGGKTIDLFAEYAGIDYSVANVQNSNNVTETVTEVNKYIIHGKGFGHGVGLSQYGANEMAKQGMTFIDILKYYYDGIEVKKIND